jgi:hypothetical protein
MGARMWRRKSRDRDQSRAIIISLGSCKTVAPGEEQEEDESFT